MRSPARFLIALTVCCFATGCVGPREQARFVSSLSPGELANAGLVHVAKIDPTLVIEMRYATANNVTGAPLYPPDFPCLLRPPAARRLAKANRFLKRRGYRLKVWDAYRPPVAHDRLWRQSGQSEYVHDPRVSPSMHCRGVSVDVTLVDKAGRYVPMPTDFDDFSENASAFYSGDDRAVKRNLRLLQRAMHEAGYLYLPSEWWHFVDQDYLTARTIHLRDLRNVQLTRNQ